MTTPAGVAGFGGLVVAAVLASALGVMATHLVSPLVVPAVVVTVLAVLLAAARPDLTLYAALFAIPLEGVPLTPVLSATEALLLLTAVGWGFQLLTGDRGLHRSTPGSALALFALATVPAAMLGLDPATGGKVVVTTSILVVLFHFVASRADEQMVVRLLGSVAAVAAVVGVMAMLDPSATGANYVGVSAVDREAGVFAHSNTLATLMVMAIPLGVMLAFVGPAGLRPAAAAAALVALVALGLTGSRGGFIALAIAALVLMAWPPVRRTVLLGVTLVVLIAATGSGVLGGSGWVDRVGQRVGTVGSASQGNDPRPNIWRGAVGMIRDDPVFGVGPGAFRRAAPAYGLLYPLGSDKLLVPPHAHDVLLNVWAERGVVAFVALLAFLVAIAVGCIRAVTAGRGRARALAVGVSASFAAFLTQSLVDDTLSTNAVAAVVISIAACVVVLARATRSGQPPHGVATMSS